MPAPAGSLALGRSPAPAGPPVLSRREALRVLGVAGLAALVVGPALACADEGAGERALAPEELPAWSVLRERDLAADVNADGADESLTLRAGSLEVRDGDGEALLVTPSSWLVADVLVADIDADGAREVVLLAWRRGNYGSARPFWEAGEEVDEEPTQHLFVYRWQAGALRPAWMSSRLGVRAAQVELLAGGNRPQLLVRDPDGIQTCWVWLSWGFALVDEAAEAAPGPTEEPTSLSLLVVGDNIAHDNILTDAYDGALRTYDFNPLYDEVRERVRAYDVAVVCQETVLVENAARASGYPRFATPQAMGDALAEAGFSVVLGATNHAADQGTGAVGETVAFWAREHPEVTLLGLHEATRPHNRVDYLGRGGIRLALFNYAYGLNVGALPEDAAWRVDTLADEDELLANLSTSCAYSDLRICFLHVGQEYAGEPTREQRALVERVIDAGADVVACSHAHVLQPWGRVRTAAGNEAVVFYGLGNFAAGQLGEARTVLGGAASLRIEKAGEPGQRTTRVTSWELLPTVCHADATTGSVRAYFLDDYTDELAARHLLSGTRDEPLTVAELRGLVPAELAR